MYVLLVVSASLFGYICGKLFGGAGMGVALPVAFMTGMWTGGILHAPLPPPPGDDLIGSVNA